MLSHGGNLTRVLLEICLLCASLLHCNGHFSVTRNKIRDCVWQLCQAGSSHLTYVSVELAASCRRQVSCLCPVQQEGKGYHHHRMWGGVVTPPSCLCSCTDGV